MCCTHSLQGSYLKLLQGRWDREDSTVCCKLNMLWALLRQTMLNFATSALDNPPVTASPWQDPLYPGQQNEITTTEDHKKFSSHFWAPSYPFAEPNFCRRKENFKKWHKLHRADMKPSGDYSSLMYPSAPQGFCSQEHIPEDGPAAC